MDSLLIKKGEIIRETFDHESILITLFILKRIAKTQNFSRPKFRKKYVIRILLANTLGN